MAPSSKRLALLLNADLLTALDEIYPERAPDPRAPHTDMVIAAAQREVVRHLHRCFEEGRRNLLSTKTT